MQNAVVGIDLSLTGTGLAAIYDKDGTAVFVTDLVKSKGKRGDGLRDRADRLNHIAVRTVDFALEKFEPALVVIEAPSYGSRFGHAHDRSGLWWMVVDLLLAEDTLVAPVAPTSRAKYATGRGNADKLEVSDAISERLGTFAGDEDDNVCDAMVLACMGRRRIGHEVDGELLPNYLVAMDGVQWGF